MKTTTEPGIWKSEWISLTYLQKDTRGKSNGKKIKQLFTRSAGSDVCSLYPIPKMSIMCTNKNKDIS